MRIVVTVRLRMRRDPKRRRWLIPGKRLFRLVRCPKTYKKQPSPSLLPLTPFSLTSSQTPESKPAIKTKDDKKKSQSQ
jgi:hypothetical protein